MSSIYFSHDSNARNSDKLLPVRMRHGAEGYGIYFMLLERLRDEKNYMSVKDYNVIAFDLRVDSSKIKSIVEDFGLFVFTENGKYFYSEGFLKRMELKDAKSKKLSEAGKLGANTRWNNEKIANAIENDSQAIAMPCETDSKKRKEKKESKVSKEKEDKSATPLKITHGEFEKVSLLEVEHQRLISQLGQELTDDLIIRLDGYKASTGKRYKSDYATILNWSRKEPDKSNNKQQSSNPFLEMIKDELGKGEFNGQD